VRQADRAGGWAWRRCRGAGSARAPSSAGAGGPRTGKARQNATTSRPLDCRQGRRHRSPEIALESAQPPGDEPGDTRWADEPQDHQPPCPHCRPGGPLAALAGRRVAHGRQETPRAAEADVRPSESCELQASLSAPSTATHRTGNYASLSKAKPWLGRYRILGVRGGFGTAEPMVSATFRDSCRARGPSAGGRLVTASFMPTVPEIFVIRRAGGRPGVVPGESTAAGHRSRPAGLPREGARTAGWPQRVHARLRRSP
jgi:hypothetical protein